MNKKKVSQSPAPFGIATKRFAKIGFHPDLDTSGSLKKDTQLSSATYYPKSADECFEHKQIWEPWKRKQNLEVFSKTLGWRNRHILDSRKFMQSLGGPGSYDLNEKLCQKPCRKDIGFGVDSRFQNRFKFNTPGVGSYGKNHIPDMNYYEKYSIFNKVGTTMQFEYDGFVSRFKRHQPSYWLSPGTYNPKDPGSLNALLKKVVSKRGPYDLFTGERDETTIKNHFGPGSFKGCLKSFYDVPTEMKRLLHPKKSKYGCWGLADRFNVRPTQRIALSNITLCWKDPNSPGPQTYDVLLKPPKPNKYPFNCSLYDPRPVPKPPITPGVGRYSVFSATHSKMKQKPTWQFLSVTKREMPLPKPLSDLLCC